MLGERRGCPGVGRSGEGGQARERMVEIAGRLMRELHSRGDIDRVDVDLQQRNVADPGLVFDLDGVVAEPYDQVGGAQEFALDLPAAALDAAERQRMILVDHALRHGGGGERQIVALDDLAQQIGVAEPHGDDPITAMGRFAAATRRPRVQWLRPARGRTSRCPRHLRHGLVGRRERDVLGQVEMHRSLRLAHCQADRLGERLGDPPFSSRIVALVIGANSA